MPSYCGRPDCTDERPHQHSSGLAALRPDAIPPAGRDAQARPMKGIKQFGDLVGETLANVENIKNEAIRFTLADGRVFKLFHYQDCCESVRVEDITGNLAALIGSPLTMADESSNKNDASQKPSEYAESWTWTFYKLATIKGYVDIRFLGESNGYYGEGVSFEEER